MQNQRPFPPEEKTPAEMAIYELREVQWILSQDLKDDEWVRISFVGPRDTKFGGTELDLERGRALDDTTLAIVASEHGRDKVFHTLFVPCVPMVFTFEVAKKGHPKRTKHIGFQPGPEPHPNTLTTEA